MQSIRKNLSLNDDLIVTTEEAALILKIPASSLVKFRSTGQWNIPFLKLGHAVRYRTSDLRKWVEAHVVQDGVA